LRFRQIAWDDPTGGLGDGSSDVAIVWLSLPEPERFCTQVLFTEPRHVALPAGHRLASARSVQFAELADEPFPALPETAGALRDHWLATAERVKPVRIGAEVATADETFEAVTNGLGVVLLSAGNAEIYRRAGIVTVAVIRDFLEACRSSRDASSTAASPRPVAHFSAPASPPPGSPRPTNTGPLRDS
jgi:DNA-binding transcriptional LysR family regulator